MKNLSKYESIIKNEMVKIANEKGYQFIDEDILESCLEYFVEWYGDDNNYQSIEEYIDETIENCRYETFK